MPGAQPAMTALFESSALDERWKTDLASFFFDFLRLLGAHEPDQLPAYLELVTKDVDRLKLWSQLHVVCIVAGAFLRLRLPSSAFGVASRALVTLLKVRSRMKVSMKVKRKRLLTFTQLLCRSIPTAESSAPQRTRCSSSGRSPLPFTTPTSPHPTRQMLCVAHQACSRVDPGRRAWPRTRTRMRASRCGCSREAAQPPTR